MGSDDYLSYLEERHNDDNSEPRDGNDYDEDDYSWEPTDAERRYQESKEKLLEGSE